MDGVKAKLSQRCAYDASFTGFDRLECSNSGDCASLADVHGRDSPGKADAPDSLCRLPVLLG
jgi:hypothetical protein